jgi:hypothetical protein
MNTLEGQNEVLRQDADGDDGPIVYFAQSSAIQSPAESPAFSAPC